MSAVYDNWERLVGATLRRDQLRRRALRSFSDLSLASSSSFNSRASSHRLGETFDNETIPRALNYLKIFTFAELKQATRNFRPDTLLGEGGSGLLFEGWIDENTYAPSRLGVGIAVIIKAFDPQSEQDLKSWQPEIEFFGKFSHPNIVKLLGYCFEDNRLLLVYEYMQKGSLGGYLFGWSGETLSWEIRMKIAIGTARALAFLHTTEGQVVRRDIKTANIWLDGDYNAKLSNFNLDEYDVNSYNYKPRGILVDEIDVWDYYDSNVPRKYIIEGDLDLKSDVYSFGVVLLQIVSGCQKLNATLSYREPNIVEWAKPFLRDRRKFRGIMDSRLEGQYSSKAVLRIARLISMCLEPDPKIWPPMEKVLEILEKIGALKVKPNDSQEEEIEGLHFSFLD